MEPTVDQATPDRPGRVLAAERERQGLNPADIAQRLHMSVWQVEALEADDYTRLPRGPFLRGFVRNYAKTVGLKHEDVLALLAEGAPREPAPRIVVPSQNIQFDADRLANPYVRAGTIAAVLLLLALAAMYWWLFVRNAPMAGARKAVTETVAAAPAPVVVTPAPLVATSTPTFLPPPSAPVEPPKAAVEAPKPEPAKVAPKPEPIKTVALKPEPAKTEPAKAEPAPSPQRVSAAASGSTLKFRFNGKSWVEIRDAAGAVILTGLNEPGSQAEVVGKPPLKVIVGNAPEVRMYVNEREFNLAPHMREAVARVTVE